MNKVWQKFFVALVITVVIGLPASYVVVNKAFAFMNTRSDLQVFLGLLLLIAYITFLVLSLWFTVRWIINTTPQTLKKDPEQMTSGLEEGRIPTDFLSSSERRAKQHRRNSDNGR